MEKQKVSQGVKVQLQAVASLRQTQAVLLTRARDAGAGTGQLPQFPAGLQNLVASLQPQQTSCAQGKDSS